MSAPEIDVNHYLDLDREDFCAFNAWLDDQGLRDALMIHFTLGEGVIDAVCHVRELLTNTIVTEGGKPLVVRRTFRITAPPPAQTMVRRTA